MPVRTLEEAPEGAPRRSRAGEVVLAEHIRQTFPSTLGGFLAKEHFWALGDRTDISRQVAGRLFMELCFPIKIKSRYEEERVDPQILELTISTRQAVGLPYPPVAVATMAVGRRGWAHLEWSKEGRGFWKDTQPITDTVVQAESVLSAATDPGESLRFASFSNAALDALVAFGDELVGLPE